MTTTQVAAGTARRPVTTTLPDEPSLRRVRRAQLWRRAGTAALVLFVLVGATGWFGTRSRTVTATANGYRISVTYPQISRPGHAVPFHVLIHHDGGFSDPIRVRMRSVYFDLFDQNSFDPAPDTTTTDATYDYYQYAAPSGPDFVISSDTRIEPARQRGEAGDVSVLDAHGRPLVTVTFRTHIVP
ncbi:MAG: hypothetical protein WCD35_00175 [Mycobacteriales bacterium]